MKGLDEMTDWPNAKLAAIDLELPADLRLQVVSCRLAVWAVLLSVVWFCLPRKTLVRLPGRVLGA